VRFGNGGFSDTMRDMEKHERDFKGVWISREIWLSRQLSLMEKALFVEIQSLDNERGCYASNRYFANFFDVSDRQIRNVIAALKSKGFVTVTVRNKNERVMRAAGKWRRVSTEEMRDLRAAQAKLADQFHVRGAGGVGRKLPGR